MSGLLLFVLLAVNVIRRVMAAFMMIAALIPIADFVNVYLNMSSNNLSALMIHGGKAACMLMLAVLLWQTGFG